MEIQFNSIVCENQQKGKIKHCIICNCVNITLYLLLWLLNVGHV